MKRSINRFITTLVPEAAEGGSGEPENLDSPQGGDTVEDTPDEGADEETAEETKQDETFDQERARSKIHKANQEARAQRAKAKAAEAKAASADEALARADKAEADVLKLRVALKYGLPEQIAQRLQGATEEELVKDAEDLLALFSPKTPTNRPRQKLSGSGGGDEPVAEKDLDVIAERMFRT